MKTTVNKIELKELGACEYGYRIFVKAHGDKDVKFSELLESNGWDDTWWVISNIDNQLSDEQKKGVVLLSCEYAPLSIYNSRGEYLEGERLRKVIESVKSAVESAVRLLERSEKAAAMKKYTKILNNLFLKWEQQQ